MRTTRNSFWVTDLKKLKQAFDEHTPNFSSLLRSSAKEYQDNPEFMLNLIEIVGTQAFYFQLPDCLLNDSEYLQLAVVADSKCLKFIPKQKLNENVLLQVIESKDQHLENLFVYPHVLDKLTFSLCHLALKKQKNLCLLSYFKTEPKLTLSKEERQILYAQLTLYFKELGQKLPAYLERYEQISDKLSPEKIDKMVDVLSQHKKLQVNLPIKIDREKRLKI